VPLEFELDFHFSRPVFPAMEEFRQPARQKRADFFDERFDAVHAKVFS
jgi:hypothetical protein